LKVLSGVTQKLFAVIGSELVCFCCSEANVIF
jgi:hypothetical protein